MKGLNSSILNVALSLSDGSLSNHSLISKTLQKALIINDNSILDTLSDESLKNATEIDNERKKGTKFPLLAGIPISIKDNFNVKGSKTTAGSELLKNYISVYDATIVESLKKCRILVSKGILN